MVKEHLKMQPLAVFKLKLQVWLLVHRFAFPLQAGIKAVDTTA